MQKEHHRCAAAIVHEGAERAEIVHVFGEVDFYNAAQLEAALTAAIRIGKRLIVDLLECPFIDAAVARVLARTHAALGDLFTVRVAAGSIPARVLRLLEELEEASGRLCLGQSGLDSRGRSAPFGQVLAVERGVALA